MSVSEMVYVAQNRALAAFIHKRMAEVGIAHGNMLAARMGVAPSSALRNVMRGLARPAPKTIKRLAVALRVEENTLLDILKRTPELDREPPPPPTRREQLPPAEVTSRHEPSFSLTMEPGGTMRLVLDVAGMAPVDAFKVIDQLRIAGLFG